MATEKHEIAQAEPSPDESPFELQAIEGLPLTRDERRADAPDSDENPFELQAIEALPLTEAERETARNT
jgi:hypothetical protein